MTTLRDQAVEGARGARAMSEHPRQIAKIHEAYLGVEDHDILSCSLFFDFGGSSQGTGAYALDEPIRGTDGEFLRREVTAYGMQFIAAVMKAAGVDSWNKVKGRTVFVLRDSDQWNAKIVGIAPLPTEPGEPFLFSALQAKHYGEPA